MLVNSGLNIASDNHVMIFKTLLRCAVAHRLAGTHITAIREGCRVLSRLRESLREARSHDKASIGTWKDDMEANIILVRFQSFTHAYKQLLTSPPSGWFILD